MLILAAGLLLLYGVWSDRGNIRSAWKQPAAWWRRGEYLKSRDPAQPLQLVLGTGLGIAAVIYGVVSIVS